MQDQPGIGRHRARRGHDDRIALELGQVAAERLRRVGDTESDRDEGVAVDGSGAPGAIEDRAAAKLRQHGVDVVSGHWQHGDGDITCQFGKGPAHPDRHHQAEGRVIDHADDHLHAGGHHLLDEERRRPDSSLGQAAAHLVDRRLDAIWRQSQAHGAHIALVHDPGPVGLEHQRRGPVARLHGTGYRVPLSRPATP